MTTEGKNGNAAQIRAVGWGQGNQANSSANAKYATVGELYIGHYDSETKTAVYDGIEFTSRPKSLTFDYKYTPGKGGDQYYAEIVIQNKQADTVTEIGRGLSRNGNSVGEWTPVTIDIEYTEAGKKMKATHMYIVFKSGKEDYDEGIAYLQETYNIPLILLTMGKDGSRAYYKGMRVERPGFSVKAIETTGAGDTFCGSSLNYLVDHDFENLTEEQLGEMLTFANAAAALVTTKKGAIKAMPVKEEVLELIQK